MNSRPIDRSKKSNIKCEHCRYWANLADSTCLCIVHNVCLCKESKHYKEETDYWIRCRHFEWPEE